MRHYTTVPPVRVALARAKLHSCVALAQVFGFLDHGTSLSQLTRVQPTSVVVSHRSFVSRREAAHIAVSTSFGDGSRNVVWNPVALRPRDVRNELRNFVALRARDSCPGSADCTEPVRDYGEEPASNYGEELARDFRDILKPWPLEGGQSPQIPSPFAICRGVR